MKTAPKYTYLYIIWWPLWYEISLNPTWFHMHMWWKERRKERRNITGTKLSSPVFYWVLCECTDWGFTKQTFCFIYKTNLIGGAVIDNWQGLIEIIVKSLWFVYSCWLCIRTVYSNLSLLVVSTPCYTAPEPHLLVLCPSAIYLSMHFLLCSLLYIM